MLHRRAGEGDARRRPQGGGEAYGELQLPSRSRGGCREADDRQRRHRADSACSVYVLAGLAGRPAVPDELADAGRCGRQRRFHGDLGAHSIDLARYLVGEIGEVVGMRKTFITERPAEGTSSGLTATAGEGTEKVTVDDASIFMAKFTGGALGTFEATRMAPGRKNYNRFELNGSKGTLVWCFEDLNYLDYYSTEDPGDRQGFRRIIATEGVHPYAGAWWPPGHMMGYDHTFSNAAADLVQCIANDKSCTRASRTGAQCVAVLEAVDKSIDGGKWAKVEIIQ